MVGGFGVRPVAKIVLYLDPEREPTTVGDSHGAEALCVPTSISGSRSARPVAVFAIASSPRNMAVQIRTSASAIC